MALALHLEQYQELAVITLEGAVRASNASQLQDTVKMLLDQGHTRIVVNCAGLISLNSHGLAILSDLVRILTSTEVEGRVVLCHVSPRIKDLLHLSGLDQFIETVSGKGDAIDRVMH